MSDHPTMEASWVQFPPQGDDEGNFYRIGGNFYQPVAGSRTITRITVQHDLPGLHCNLRRVCVWVGDQLAIEAPLHAVEAVGYPLEGGGQTQ